MGSSCSFARSCNDTGNFGKQCKTDSSPCRRSESTKSQVGVVEATNDEPSTTSQEQHSTSQAGPSFAWLVSTPVVIHATGRELKAKGKEPLTGKEEKCVLVKSGKGEYALKSWQHPAQSVQHSNSGSRQIKDASPSSSSGHSQYLNSAKSDSGSHHGANKKKQAKQFKVTFSKSCSNVFE